MGNEKRLIDANALRKQMFSYYGCVNENSSKEYYRDETLMNYEVADMIEDCIDNAPTVDAEEVVHGRWTHDAVQTCDLFDDSLPVWVDVMQCSVCNEYIEGSHGTSYCPNCGAKMDGGNEDV